MAFSNFAPPKFAPDTTGNPGTAWRRFKDELQNYYVAAALQNCNNQRKIAILTYIWDRNTG